MATKKSTGKPHDMPRHSGTATRKHVDDPAEKYYEQSRRDREAYKKAVKLAHDESSWSDDPLSERHHDVLGQEGNARSRSGFDFSTFRSKI
jgi:hypothetical protein